MKKILYSPYTKFIAGALIVILAFCGVYNVIMTAHSSFSSELGFIYDSGDSFEDTSYFSNYLGEPECHLFNAYSMFADKFDGIGGETSDNRQMSLEKEIIVEKPINSEVIPENDFTETSSIGPITIKNVPSDADFITVFKTEESNTEKLKFEAIEEYLTRALYEYSGKINYFISINGSIISNCGATNADELINTDIPYMYAHRGFDGKIIRDMSGSFYGRFYMQDFEAFENTDDIVVCTAITEDFYEQCRYIWFNQNRDIKNSFLQFTVFFIMALVLFIYLLAVIGKNSDGECKSIWLDRIWTEIHLAVVLGVIAFGIASVAVIVRELWHTGSAFYMASVIASLAFALATVITLLFSLSVARKFRCRCFLKTTLVCIIFKKLLRAVKAMLAVRTSVYLAAMLFIYTAIIGLCGIFTPESALFFFAAVALYIAAACAVAFRIKAFDEIKKGVGEIAGGNLSYKIPEQNGEDMKELAENINGIAGGLDKSVEAKIKAERMKTELITNVSHDIKTPLTSIINYTELLSGMEELPEEAKDYVSIIAAKSDRLKQLTSDLFDISKVQSGNEIMNLERLNVSLLVSQALAEYDKELAESSLQVVSDLDKSLEILADGKKMSRVIGNLLGNILKYSLSGTRVFITAKDEDGKAVIEFKNISAYPLDFSADEITERFVRGEESRSAEGNGLGLAIARSYTEACGGKFRITLDGDLFKAEIVFSKIV